MTNLSNIAGFQAPTASSGVLLGTTIDTHNVTVSPGSSNPTGSTSYSGFMPAAAPTASNLRTRDTFAHWAQWRSPNSSASGFTMCSFQVNRSNGQISAVSNNQNVWYNSSGSAMSTTYLIYDPTHGNFFSGGHNAYPGYSSHVFGYTYGRLAPNGSVSGGGSYSNADHGFNGTYCGCLPSANGGNNYFITGGYNGSGGSYAGGRVITCSASGPSVGGFSNHGSWTSSSSGCHHVWQPDHQGYSNGEAISIIATSYNNPYYGYKYIPQGSTSQVTLSTYYPSTYNAEVLGANVGHTVVHNTNSDFFYINNQSAYDLANGYPDFSSQYSKGKTVGVGDDCFLYLGDFNDGHGVFFKMDTATRQPIKVQRVPLVDNGEKAFLPSTGSNVQYFVVYAQDTDTHPKYLVTCRKNTGLSFTVTTQEILVDFDVLKA